MAFQRVARKWKARKINKLVVKSIVTAFGKIIFPSSRNDFPRENHLFIEVIRTNLNRCKTRIKIKKSLNCISKFPRVSIGDILLKRKIASQGGVEEATKRRRYKRRGEGGISVEGFVRRNEGYAEERTRVAKETRENKEGGGGAEGKREYRLLCGKNQVPCAYVFSERGFARGATRPPGSPSEGGCGRGGAKRARGGKGESSGHTWATTARPSLTPTKENRYAWFTHARACWRGLEGSERGALARGAEWRWEGEREGPKESRATEGGERRKGRWRGTDHALHRSVLLSTAACSRNEMGGRASGCTTVVRIPRPDTRVILYTSARARDGEGYTPRCYPLGHSISRVRGSRVVTLTLRRVAACLVPGLGDPPLPVTQVFHPLPKRGNRCISATIRHHARETWENVRLTAANRHVFAKIVSDASPINFDS